MAAPERDRGVDVVEIRGANGPDDGLDSLDGLEVLDPRRRVSGWLIVGAVALLAIGGVVGWFAGHTQRAPATVVTVAASPPPVVTVAATPPPVGCPDNARVAPILPIQSDPLVSAMRAWFPTFGLVNGNRGQGVLGRICGASLTVRDPGGVTVDVTIVSASSVVGDPLFHRPTHVLRLEPAGSDDIRAELLEVTEQGATIDVLVTGPTGPRAPTTAMENLASDPRLDLT
jgi:hypothetical protein